MSAYPQSFEIPCLCGSGCPNQACPCSNPKCPCASSSSNKKTSQLTTTHCQAYGAPTNVIQDNTVNWPQENQHTWSNQRGYGNVVISTVDSANNVRGRVSPWNRIPSLVAPIDVSIDPSVAWSQKKNC